MRGVRIRDARPADAPAILVINRQGVPGVASALYADVAGAARERGISVLACEVNLKPENPISLRFHARQGFVEIGTLGTRDGRIVSLMSASLRS